MSEHDTDTIQAAARSDDPIAEDDTAAWPAPIRGAPIHVLGKGVGTGATQPRSGSTQLTAPRAPPCRSR